MKKVYKAPKLIKIDSINKITQAVTNQGTKDGGTMHNHSS